MKPRIIHKIVVGLLNSLDHFRNEHKQRIAVWLQKCFFWECLLGDMVQPCTTFFLVNIYRTHSYQIAINNLQYVTSFFLSQEAHPGFVVAPWWRHGGTGCAHGSHGSHGSQVHCSLVLPGLCRCWMSKLSGYGYGSIPIHFYWDIHIHKSQLWLGVH
jgi:hypothetical protein